MDVLELSTGLCEAMFDHVRAGWPLEACGILLGRPTEPASLTFLPLENLQDRMHALEPAQYPRDGRTAFYIDPLQLDRLVDRAQQAGGDLVAILHSHPQYPSYFSATDRSAATPFGFPTYPQAWHLVASVYDREIRDLKAFRWDEAQETFLEVPLRGVPSLPGPPPGAAPLADGLEG